MKTLYLDCGMGAAGDMLTAALLELLPEEEQKKFMEQMNHLGIPGVEVEATKTAKCGIQGTHISVKVNGEEEKVTPNCRMQCSGCGAAKFGGGVCYEGKN